MTPREQTCKECGAPFTAHYPKTKYCRVCALVKHRLYFAAEDRDPAKDCYLCDKPFIPIGKQIVCGSCMAYRSKSVVTAECGFCGERKDVLAEEVHVCAECANDPAKQKPFLKALIAKQQERRGRAAV